ncbi:MAG: protein-export chaperone SecB [Gammaproteobacteria bacterium]
MAEEKQPKGPQLAIQKIYVKDLSFEAPNTPEIFMEQAQPQVDLQMHNESKSLQEDMHEVTLTITVTVKLEEKTVYLVEVKQAGIFLLAGFNEEQLTQVSATACPSILFPYAREAVSDLVTRGGFPPLLLNPVNFDAVYQQELARREQKH